MDDRCDRNDEVEMIRRLLESEVDLSGSADALRRSVRFEGVAIATDEDLRRAAEIVARIVDAMVVGGADDWKAISAAYEKAEGLDGTRGGVQAKLRRLVHAVEYYAQHKAKFGEGPPIGPFIRKLAICDPALQSLDPATTQADLDAIDGPTGLGAQRATARLLCRVAAFSETDENKAYERIRTAFSNAKRK